MAEQNQVRAGMAVRGSDGSSLGEVEELMHDSASGIVTGFSVKSGWWFLAKSKVLSIDLVETVDTNANTVEVKLPRAEFRAMPERS